MKTTTALAVALLALVVAACGGASDEVGGSATPAGRRRRRERPSSRSSPTPSRRSASTRSSRPSTRRPRARASRSASPTAPPATSRARSSPACRPTSSTSASSPTSRASSRPAWSTRPGTRTSTRASRSARSSRSSPARATRRASRPGTTCSSPASRSSRPNPFSSGSAKWNLLAPYAEKSNGGKDPEAGLAYLAKLIGDHVKVQPKSGREATETFLQGTGDVLLSYENEALFAERNGEDVEHAHAGHDVQDREPGRGRQHVQEQGAGAGLRRLPVHARGPEGVGRGRLPPGRPDRRAGVRRRLPGAEEALDDRRPRRLEQGQRRALRARRPAPWPRSTTRRRASARWRSLALPPAAQRRQAHRRRRRRAPRARRRHAVAEHHRPAAARGGAGEVARGRAGRASGTRSRRPAARARCCITVVDLADRRADQRRHRHADRVGAGPRRLPRQGRSSTRSSTCRSRCRRSWPRSCC